MEDKQYAQRFNQGYAIKMNSPALADKLFTSLEKKEKLSEQDKAFMAGMKQMEMEMSEVLKEYEKPQNFTITDTKLSMGQDLDKDKEPEL